MGSFKSVYIGDTKKLQKDEATAEIQASSPSSSCFKYLVATISMSVAVLRSNTHNETCKPSPCKKLVRKSSFIARVGQAPVLEHEDTDQLSHCGHWLGRLADEQSEIIRQVSFVSC